jgi:hypothetical protein
MSEVYIGVSRSDGSVVHVAFQTVMRAPTRPDTGGWQGPDQLGRYFREASDSNIAADLARFNEQWAQLGDPTMTGWRKLSDPEHEMFNQNRAHRNALEDVGGKIQHNMPKARELHREYLRHYNGDKLIGLDRDWVNASVAKDNAKIKATEDKRKALADTVVDPRIEAAKTIEELLLVTPAVV